MRVSTSFFEPTNNRCRRREAEGAPEPTQARTLLISTQEDLPLCALLGVFVGGRILAALAPARVTEEVLLGVIGGEADLDEIVASTVAAVDNFGNHALILARHSYHSRLVHYHI